MFPRYVIRSIVPTAYKFCKSAAAGHSPKLGILSHSRAPSQLPISSISLQLRFYSQEAAAPLPAVDYDYVKRATTQNEVIIIDVREPDEIKENGKIPNSVNIPSGNVNASLAMSDKEFQQLFNKPKPKENTEIIFYCKIGKRSGIAQQAAVQMGFKNTKNYLGSWTDWAVKNQ